MIAVDLVKADGAIGQSAKYLGSAFVEQLISAVNRLDPRRLFSRFRYDVVPNETIRELNLLGDHYLDDVGVRRAVDRRADDLVNRLRLGG